MNHTSQTSEPRPRSLAFESAFEALLLRMVESPDDRPGHAHRAALAAAAVRDQGARVLSGVETAAIPERLTLADRLRSRRVDALEVAAGATVPDLLAMARALAGDTEELPATATVRVTMVSAAPAPDPASPPVDRRRHRHSTSILAAEVPHDPDTDRLTELATAAVVRRAWPGVLEYAEALLHRVAVADEEDRRRRLIAARRALPRPALDGLLTLALREPAFQHRVATVLSRLGGDGLDVIVDGILDAETVGPRQFLHDAIVAVPEAAPLLRALLARPVAWQVRHGAALLGRLGDPAAIEPLITVLDHPDETVRREAAVALARFDHPAARAALARGLSDPSPVARAAVARAIGGSGSAELVERLMPALQAEPDAVARQALAEAVGRAGDAGALGRLTDLAVARRTWLHRGAWPIERRLDLVAGLAAARTEAARRSLDRIAREAERPVRDAADRALRTTTRPAM